MRLILLAALLALSACGPTPEKSEAAPVAEAPVAEAPAPPASSQSGAQALASMPSWAEARAAGIDFRAVGQEPGWVLNIYRRDKIQLIWDYAEHAAEFPLPDADTSQEGAIRYGAEADGHSLTVVIRRLPCQDAMSGQAFPATVTVSIDGRALQGCGKSV